MKPVLRKDYSSKRIFRKLLFQFASRFPFLTGNCRAYLFFKGGVRFKNYNKTFVGNNVYFDDLHPELISVGENTIITEGAKILSHFLDTNFYDFEHQYLGEVTIGDNVFIGMNVVIIKPITIGDGSIIGANSVVNKDIPPGTIWAGNPVRCIKVRKI